MPIPELSEIAADDEFEPMEITNDDFETVWAQAGSVRQRFAGSPSGSVVVGREARDSDQPAGAASAVRSRSTKG